VVCSTRSLRRRVYSSYHSPATAYCTHLSSQPKIDVRRQPAGRLLVRAVRTPGLWMETDCLPATQQSLPHAKLTYGRARFNSSYPRKDNSVESSAALSTSSDRPAPPGGTEKSPLRDPPPLARDACLGEPTFDQNDGRSEEDKVIADSFPPAIRRHSRGAHLVRNIGREPACAESRSD
jgi:hypothetical protein